MNTGLNGERAGVPEWVDLELEGHAQVRPLATIILSRNICNKSRIGPTVNYLPPREYLIPLSSIGSKRSVELTAVARQFHYRAQSFQVDRKGRC
jgi:hypothetical protein